MITIFTPTYNRAYILPKLFDSLKRQITLNFEWIIYDDGSNDNTEEIVNGFIAEKVEFPIIYVKKKNGGKHKAINYGVNIAKGEFFLIVDSDDYLLPEAIYKIDLWVNEIKNNKNYDKFAAVSGLRGNGSTKVIGQRPDINKKFIDCSNLERRKFHLLGDKAEIYKTDILRKFPFPEFENENFLTEEIVWNRIAKAGYIIRWYNEIIYICEYLPDGLTNNIVEKNIKNFEGYTLYVNETIRLKGFFEKLRMKRYYTFIAKEKGLPISKISKNINSSMLELNMLYILGSVYIKIKKYFKI